MKALLLIFTLFALCFGEIKIASFNVANLFDEKQDGSEYSDFKKGGKKNWTKEKYEKKIKGVSDDIKSIDADVILLLEVENARVLKRLADICGYEYLLFTKGNNEAPVGLGYLSKRKIQRSKEYLVRGVKTRPVLQISVNEGEKTLNLFGAHFPAMKNDLSKRKSAANTMIKAVNGVKNAIILGDLNSKYGDGFLLNSLNDDFISIWEYKKGWNSYKGKKGGKIDHIMISKDLAGQVKPKFWVHDNVKSSDHNALSVSF